MFLDSDDFLEADALGVLVKALYRHPGAAAASGLARLVDSEGDPCEPGELEIGGRHRMGWTSRGLAPWPVSAATTLSVLAYRNYIGTPGQALIRCASLEATGLFDPAAAPCEDWDMWLRLSQRGDIEFVDRVLLSYRWHDGNISRNGERMAAGMAYVRRKLLSVSGMSREQRTVVLAANRCWGLQLRSSRLGLARRCLADRRLRAAAVHVFQAVRSYARCLQGLAAS
jgi:hypothetical protein